jgi:copper chaperone NosL
VRRRAKRSWIALALLTAACGSGRLEPVPLPLDRASCAACGMLISDPRAAAQAVVAGEDPRFYDDIGCAASDRSLPRTKAQIYVSAGSGARWIKAEAAFFARVPDLRTPMGYGVAAFPTRPQAQTSDSQGRARAWSEIQSDLSKGGVR